MQPNSAVTLQNNGFEIKGNDGQLLQGVVKSLDKDHRVVYLSHDPDTVSKCVHVKTGDIYDSARVVRVDRGFGLLLEIPSTPVPTVAYVSICDVDDEEVRNLEKKYKDGNIVRARILGFRHLEGLALGTMKASAFEGSVFTHSDAKP
ncbi:hypothetical protein MKX01_033904, partial [Papaver californicum]